MVYNIIRKFGKEYADADYRQVPGMLQNLVARRQRCGSENSMPEVRQTFQGAKAG